MNTSTATLDGKGVTRPPVSPATSTSPEGCIRVITVTRFGLAVVSYVDASGSEVRHG